MKIIVAIPTKSISDPLLTEGVDYLRRSKKPLSAEALFIAPKLSINEAEQRVNYEGLMLLKKTEGFMRIALCENGSYFSSLQFVNFLKKHIDHNRKLAFIVGGAFGLSLEVVKKCDETLSLSPMTLPHKMAFLVLCEQIYRAGEIVKNTPYHK